MQVSARSLTDQMNIVGTWLRRNRVTGKCLFWFSTEAQGFQLKYFYGCNDGSYDILVQSKDGVFLLCQLGMSTHHQISPLVTIHRAQRSPLLHSGEIVLDITVH